MENWHVNMYDSMRTANPKVVTGIYYIAWIFIGNFVLLNLLLSIIFDAFAQEEAEDNAAVDPEVEKALAVKKKQLLEKMRERRLKKLGQTNAGGNKSMLGLTGPQSPQQRPPPKKQKKSFTGVNEDNQIEQFFDDFEDLDQDKILDFLKTAKVIKIADSGWYKRPVP